MSTNNIYDDVALLQEQMAAITADSGWLDIPLNSGWSMNDYTTDKPQYRKIGNRVMLRGIVSATAEAGNAIATLPIGFRPANNRFSRWACPLNNGTAVSVQVNYNGILMDVGKTTSTTRTYLALNGITFLTD